MRPPSGTPDDYNLLLGVLALRTGLVSREALLDAFDAWALDKAKPLKQVLRDRGALRGDALALLETLAAKNLERNGPDPRQSLAVLSTLARFPEDLPPVADPDLQASLSHLTALGTTPDRPSGNKAASAGTPTSSGLRFRVLRSHAQGGLGQVSVALDEELNREVALKEIQERYADDPQSRARFLLEAEVTGRLEHPGIVPVYGLGRDAGGRPFYAMRFIQGDSFQVAIDHFHEADGPYRDPGERGLALRGLLGRFVDVCDAVAYAHSRGILHRDLKPGNVMLGPYGETLLVDWGLAKPISGQDGALPPGGIFRPQSADSVGLTQVGAAVGTPAYMAPEQAAGLPGEVGPASDVYSLGATLYYLLTGKVPFAGDELGDLLYRVQVGQFPPPRRVKPAVPAALEAVCLKAMALQPPDRYGGARALAEDVEHWLADEPVSAYREPAGLRLNRWARRHKTVVSGAAVLLVTAVAALAVGLAAVRREQQRTEAALAAEARRRQQTRQALDALSSQVVEEWLARQEELSAEQKKFLEQALAWYEEFAQDTGRGVEVQAGAAQACRRVGLIRYRLGQAREAEAAYARSRELYARLAEEFPDRTEFRQELAKNHNNLANLLADSDRLTEAEADYRHASEIQHQLAVDHPEQPSFRRDLAASRSNLGNLLADTGRVKEAETAYHEALELRQQLVKDWPDRSDFRQELAQSHNNLAILFKDTGRVREAEAAYREALALQERLVADAANRLDSRRQLAVSHSNLGTLFQDTGRWQEAEVSYRAALALQQRLVADFPGRPDLRLELARSHNNLAHPLKKNGRVQEAEASFREARAVLQRLVADFPGRPDFSSDLASVHGGLGNLLWETHRATEAEAAYREALALQRVLAADFPSRPDFRFELAQSHHNLGDLFQASSRPREAEASYREALERLRPLATEPSARPDFRNELAATLGDLGRLLRDDKDLLGARRVLEEALAHHQAALRALPENPVFRSAYRRNRALLADTLLRMTEHAGAATAAAELLEASGATPGDAFAAGKALARCAAQVRGDSRLSEGQRHEQAAGYAERAVAALRQAFASGFKETAQLKADPDLEPLRGRDDFLKLRGELEAHGKTADR